MLPSLFFEPSTHRVRLLEGGFIAFSIAISFFSIAISPIKILFLSLYTISKPLEGLYSVLATNFYANLYPRFLAFCL